MIRGVIFSHNVHLNVLIEMSMSENSINNLLSKLNLICHMLKKYDLNVILDCLTYNINVPSNASLRTGVLVRCVVFDRASPDFTSPADLNTILNVLCCD